MRMRRKAWTEPVLADCPYLIESPQALRGHWRDHFARPELPLQLEIGCGKGVSTVQMARENPQINFVAIDEVRHVLAVTVKNANAAYAPDPVTNLLLSAVDAMFIQDSFAAADRIARIYLNFPNPWGKRTKHHKRRLTHPRQLMQYREILAPEGEIHFKTDDAELFAASKDYLLTCGFELRYATDDLHASGYAPNYVSEHEALYAGRGIPIHFLIARMAGLPAGFDWEFDGRRLDHIARGAQPRGKASDYIAR